MKVYISHNWDARQWLKDEVVPLVEAAGHTVISRWIMDEPIHDCTLESVIDIEDVRASDALILFAHNFGLRPGRGKYVEFGSAIAWGKRCIIIHQDNADCIFYALPNIRHAKTIEEAITAI